MSARPTTIYSYATAANKVSVAVIEHAGLSAQITYDEFGRETARTVTGAGVALAGAVTARDAEGRRVAWNVGDVASSAGYDAAGKLVSQTAPGISAAYTYDADTARKTARTVTGAGVALAGAVTARDAEGRRVAWNVGDVASSAGYDAAGKLVSQTAPGISAAYTYDADTARKTGESVTLAGQGAVASSYAYTDAGRLQGAVTGATQRAYAFDARGNLTAAGSAEATTTFVVDANDRLTSSVTGDLTTNYSHDLVLGRRTSQTTSGVTTTYTYDDASRLTGWARGTDSATYTYDGNGQRTSATVTVGGLTTTTDYTYDGITLLSLSAARSDETTFSVAYLTGEDGRPYAGVYTAGDASAVTFLIATTDRGDVVALTNAEGAVFARYTYDPYGAVLSQDSSAATGITSGVAAAIATRQPLRYAGYTYDAHSATYYLSQRHYDPATMRFLTKDPARDDGEESAYQYCAGDPVGRVDPSGLLYWRIRDLGKEIDRTCDRLWRHMPKLGGWWLLRTIGLNEGRWLKRAREIMYDFYRRHDATRYGEAKSYVDFHGKDEGLRQYFERRGPAWGNYLHIKKRIGYWKEKGLRKAYSTGKPKVR